MTRVLILVLASAVVPPWWASAKARQVQVNSRTSSQDSTRAPAQSNQAQTFFANDALHNRNFVYWTVAPDALGASLVPVDATLRAHLKIEEGVGLAVVAVVPGSPADRMGLRKNDIVLDLDGHALGQPDGLVKALSELPRDAAEAPMNVLRGGQKAKVKVDLKALRDLEDSRTRLFQNLYQPRNAEAKEDYYIGVQTTTIDDTLRAQLKLGEGVGLLITDVVADSPASEAGLLKNDVLYQLNTTGLKETKDLVEAIQKTESKEVPLHLFREGKDTTVRVYPKKRAGRHLGLEPFANTPTFERFYNYNQALPNPPNTSRDNLRRWTVNMQGQAKPTSDQDAAKLDAILKELKELRAAVDSLKAGRNRD